ncbi:MAG: acyl-CoA dehydrogenase, partial [Gammaproteobacteria bacterium]|nr:acyl-CoA dehydrogenase [Gammaproteobacteria bacterium]
MNDFLILAGLIAIPLAVMYRRDPILNAALALAVLTVLSLMVSASGILTLLAALAAVASGLAAHKGLRVEHVTRPLFAWFKSVLPQLSPTEQEAIDAGTVWW